MKPTTLWTYSWWFFCLENHHFSPRSFNLKKSWPHTYLRNLQIKLMYSFEANPPNVCSSPNTSPELMRKFSDNNTPLIPWETFTKQPANHKVNVSYCCDEPTLCSWSVGKAMQHKPHGFVMEMAGYKYRALTLTQSQTSLCSPETETSMAPHSVIISTFDHQRFTDKDKFKVRSYFSCN